MPATITTASPMSIDRSLDKPFEPLSKETATVIDVMSSPRYKSEDPLHVLPRIFMWGRAAVKNKIGRTTADF